MCVGAGSFLNVTVLVGEVGLGDGALARIKHTCQVS